MRLGICCPPTNLTQCPDGLDYIEPSVAAVLCPDANDDDFAACREAVRSAPAPVRAVNCLFPGSLKTTGPDVDAEAVDAWIRTVCQRSADLGIAHIVFGSGGSRRVPEGFDHAEATEQLVGHLKRFGPIAAESGVTIVVEPLQQAECNIVTSVSEGALLVRRVDHPNIRLLADTYHMASDGEGPEAIRDAGELIHHVHCAEENGREPLGTKGIDHRPYFRALKDIGYSGGVSIEAGSWDDLQAELPAALKELRTQIDTA